MVAGLWLAVLNKTQQYCLLCKTNVSPLCGFISSGGFDFLQGFRGSAAFS
jgi:hypothetical protein